MLWTAVHISLNFNIVKIQFSSAVTSILHSLKYALQDSQAQIALSCDPISMKVSQGSYTVSSL
jgi:hypothetical protein